jgi:hypothetical protein
MVTAPDNFITSLSLFVLSTVTGMEKDIHPSHKGQGAATNREKGQGVTRTRAAAAPC